jgi:hypothetical protein
MTDVSLARDWDLLLRLKLNWKLIQSIKSGRAVIPMDSQTLPSYLDR